MVQSRRGRDVRARCSRPLMKIACRKISSRSRFPKIRRDAQHEVFAREERERERERGRVESTNRPIEMDLATGSSLSTAPSATELEARVTSILSHSAPPPIEQYDFYDFPNLARTKRRSETRARITRYWINLRSRNAVAEKLSIPLRRIRACEYPVSRSCCT